MPDLGTLSALAAKSGPGRSENPDEGSGLLIIVGVIVVIALVLLAVGLMLRSRAGRTRGDIFRRKPHRRGRVGRIR